MRYAYPFTLEPEENGSAVNVSFPDVPGALTWGADEAEASAEAEDCLIAILGGYIAAREPIPTLLLSNSHRPGRLGAFTTLAQKLAGDGITLNTILPGRIATDRIKHLHGSIEKAQEVAREQIPIGRLGTAEELAAAAAFLCSERASYITGVALLVDGGLTKGV